MIPYRYFLYDEVTAVLNEFVEKYPSLCSLSSIGSTYEGRDIWCLTVCRRDTGAPEEKAAFFMDGNLHSGEVASSMAVLYTLDKWLSAYGRDPEITRLMDRYAVYAIPRVSADAAEVFLTTPRETRGSVEPYYPEENGVQPQDLDGDGEIRQMRVQDIAGQWKAWDRDPRVMVSRQPDDVEGTFYTLVSEGLVRGGPEELVRLKDARPRDDLDPNRQFPFEWNKDYPEPDRPTSGPAPLHDKEVKALHGFVCAHPNIAFHMSFHTYGGLHISPAAFCPHLNAPDGEAMKRLGLAMRKKTGYKCEGIFPEGAKDIAPGSCTTWEYFEKGIMAYVTELWDFHFQADPQRPEGWSMFFAESEEQFFREKETALQWDEKYNGGKGFKPWTSFDHPQLEDAKVEIGGWSKKFSIQNPPVPLLPGVCEKGSEAALVGLKAMPRIAVVSLKITREDEKAWIDAEIVNLGFLPASGTKNAAEKGLGTEIAVTLGGCEALGKNPVILDTIDGFSRKLVRFPAKLPPEGEITVTVSGVRCGKAQAALRIAGSKGGKA